MRKKPRIIWAAFEKSDNFLSTFAKTKRGCTTKLLSPHCYDIVKLVEEVKRIKKEIPQ